MAAKVKPTKYVISACLLGIPCRWNGKAKPSKRALKAFYKGNALVVCPEVLGGLPTPRPACEIKGGDGHDVLSGKARIIDAKGRNHSAAFICGAKRALRLAIQHGATDAILKSGSPSCGAGCIYAGNFSGKKRKGVGVFSALLKKREIKTHEEE